MLLYSTVSFDITCTSAEDFLWNFKVFNCEFWGVTGQVVVDTSLPLRSRDYRHITSVRPLAVAATGKAQFTVKGINLRRPGTRFYVL